MARVTTVQKARKDQGQCSRCGDPVSKGDPYRWAQPGFRGRRIVRCMKATCNFRQSDLDTSNLQGAWSAVEDAEDALDNADTVEDIKAALEQCADELDEVASLYQDAMDSWAGDTPPDEWQERYDTLESAASELRDWEPDDPDEPDEEEEPEDEFFAEEKPKDETKDEAKELAAQEHVETVREAAREALADAQQW